MSSIRLPRARVGRRDEEVLLNHGERETLRYSIIVPTYGRPETLRACLEGCRALQYAPDAFEVIVVDDGDQVETRQVVAELAHALRLTYRTQPNRRGPAVARNAGAAVARGTHLAFVDDDCIPDPGWLQGLDEVFESARGPVVAGGRIVNNVEHNVYASASQNLVDFLYDWHNADPGDARFFASNNLACPSRAFREIGGFDESFPHAAAEDRDFCDRWRERGWRLVAAPGAVVRHRHRLTMASFVRQHAGYGRGAVFLHRGRARRGVERPRLEPLRFYGRLLAYPATKERSPRLPAMLLLALVSQVAYAAGYYGERIRQRRQTGTEGAAPRILIARRAGVPDPHAGPR